MTEVFSAMLRWLTSMLDGFMSQGGYIALFIVLYPLFLRVVRALRTIIKK